MAHPDDPSAEASNEWLSPTVYRQLCDAVDAALTTPPAGRHALLAARLGNDERLLAEAHALLASYEASPRTVVTLVPPPPAEPESEGATLLIRPTDKSPANDEGRQQVNSSVWDAPAEPTRSSGTVVIPPPSPAPPVSGARPASGSSRASETTPIAGVPAYVAPQSGSRPAAPASSGSRPAYQEPPPPVAAPVVSPLAPAAPLAPPPPQAYAPDDLAAAGRSQAAGAPVPTRPDGGGRSLATALSVLLGLVMVLAAAVAVWFWIVADRGRKEAEARLALATERLALSEKRFEVVRQLGTRLAEVDRMLAVTEDAGARTARAVLVRTWLQYLQDLQRASGGTDRGLLLEVARGYRQVAATQGGTGQTLGDLAGAGKTLQIGIRLLEYLDRTGRQPEPAVLRELTVSTVALGDVLAAGKDAAAATEHYRKALAVAERLGGISTGDANVTRDIETIRQRLQAGPPATP